MLPRLSRERAPAIGTEKYFHNTCPWHPRLNYLLTQEPVDSTVVVYCYFQSGQIQLIIYQKAEFYVLSPG